MIPTHLHSHYSALDGYSRPDEIADRLVELGLAGSFLTDHGTVAGLAPFAKAMKKQNLWVGYGIEAYQASGKRTEKKNADGKSFKKGEDAYHLVLLAKTQEGYRNLLRISDESHRTGFHYDPRVDLELLQRYHEGVICTTACMGSLVNQELLWGGGSKKPLNDLQKIFGDDLFIEIHTYPTEEQYDLNELLVATAKERGLRLLVATDAHYMRPDDYDAHEALLCAQYNDKLDRDKGKRSNHPTDKTRWHPECLYIMGEDEVRERLDYLPDAAVDQAIENTDLLMEECSFELEKPGLFLPKVKGGDSTAMLEDLVGQGLYDRYEEPSDEVLERAETEFDAIVGAGLQDYFLIVHDYITYALQQGIMVGPGRGSVGGSILAYALGITSIDPIKHELQFERFWNPGRAEGLPDIDVDFEQSARQFMIEAVKRKYGSDCVLSIGNHIFIRPLSAIDKAGMVLYTNPPYGKMGAIKKLIKSTTDAGIAKPWDEMWAELGDWAERKGEPHPLEEFEEQLPDMFALAKDLSGRLSTYGVHASAVVISEVPLQDHLPARMASDDDKRKVLCTQAEMHAVEDAGFPKFDFLGLRNLDTIMMAGILSGEFGDPGDLAPRLQRLIEQRRKGIIERADDELREALCKIIAVFRDETNYDHLPDSYWEQVDKGHTLGFFQIEEGRDARRIGKQLHPRCLDDLAFIVALNRPGPLRDLDQEGRSTVDRFLARRNDEEDTVYAHPFLEDLLEKTYGDFLYQEQVIAYFRKIGYSLSDADHIRKILGKKLVTEMEKEFPTYMSFATQHMEKQAAKLIWDKIQEFSKYSFNKAHAVGYGTILAWTMYAKWRWPVEFVMASITTNSKRVPAYIGEARRIGVSVLPPDIDFSETMISKRGDAIIYGLRDIKGLGAQVADWIVDHRPYSSPEDFYQKCIDEKPVVVRSNVRDALMDAGAFDGFGYRLAKCEKCGGKGRLRLDPTVRKLATCPVCNGLMYDRVEIPNIKTRVALEEELFGGIAITDEHADLIKRNSKRIGTLDDLMDADIEEDGEEFVVPGIIKDVQELEATWYVKPPTPKVWARVTIEWQGEEITFAAWPKDYNKKKASLRKGIVGEFTLETDRRGPKLVEMERYV